MERCLSIWTSQFRALSEHCCRGYSWLRVDLVRLSRSIGGPRQFGPNVNPTLLKSGQRIESSSTVIIILYNNVDIISSVSIQTIITHGSDLFGYVLLNISFLFFFLSFFDILIFLSHSLFSELNYSLFKWIVPACKSFQNVIDLPLGNDVRLSMKFANPIDADRCDWAF